MAPGPLVLLGHLEGARCGPQNRGGGEGLELGAGVELDAAPRRPGSVPVPRRPRSWAGPQGRAGGGQPVLARPCLSPKSVQKHCGRRQNCGITGETCRGRGQHRARARRRCVVPAARVGAADDAAGRELDPRESAVEREIGFVAGCRFIFEDRRGAGQWRFRRPRERRPDTETPQCSRARPAPSCRSRPPARGPHSRLRT